MERIKRYVRLFVWRMNTHIVRWREIDVFLLSPKQKIFILFEDEWCNNSSIQWELDAIEWWFIRVPSVKHSLKK